MRLEWREEAIADLERIDLWLSQIENANAIATRRQIDAAASKLERLGDIGGPERSKAPANSLSAARPTS